MLGVALCTKGLGVVIYDTSTWQRVHLITGAEYVMSVSFSPDSLRIVSGDHEGMVRLWDCTSGEELLIMKGHANIIRLVAYSPCGNRIASASKDETVRLWDSET